jgi:putative colanic acid biosynthesis acetyltransferase WcaF
MVRLVFFRPTPEPLFRGWRIFLLRCFGARIGFGCRVSSSVRVWQPWSLEMGNYVCMASQVDCYNVSPIKLGDYVTVSQRSFLCTAGHDIRKLSRPLTHQPISIDQHAWICAEAFVGPGVRVGEGAVLAARGVATRDIPAWEVHGGVPASKIADRVIDE